MSIPLHRARYVSLATFRKSGEAVATPVWAAFDNDEFLIFSAGDAGKVKRLRNGSRARLAVCDARGKLLGDYHDATAEILSHPGDTRRALRLLRRKYGWQMTVADVLAKLMGRFHKRAYIRVKLNPT